MSRARRLPVRAEGGAVASETRSQRLWTGVRHVVVRSLACAAALALTAPGAQAAGAGAGTAAGSFLSVGAGASVLSMSGATLATGRDLAASSWNVASLARVDALEFALSHAPLPGGATQDWLAAGGRLGGGATRWGLSALFHQEGALDGRDASNQPTGALSVSDVAFGARVARPLAEHLSAGIGAEWVHESLAGANGSGVAFDAGVRAHSGAFGFALAARHLGGQMDYSGARYDLPGVIAAGVSWADEVSGLRFAADYESPAHYYPGVRLGGEWRMREWMALRAGYRRQLGEPATESLSGASFGLGTGVGNLWMDYSYAPEGGAGGGAGAGQHRLGLTFRPGHANASDANAHTSRPTLEHTPRPAREPATVKPARTEPAPPVSAPAAAVSKLEPADPAPVAAASQPKPAPPASVTESKLAPPTTVAGSKPVPPASVAESKPAPPATVAGSKPVPPATVAESKPAPPPPPVSPVIVRPAYLLVGAGETLAMLARRWNTTVPALMMANNLVNERVQPGQRLKLPGVRSR